MKCGNLSDVNLSLPIPFRFRRRFFIVIGKSFVSFTYRQILKCSQSQFQRKCVTPKIRQVKGNSPMYSEMVLFVEYPVGMREKVKLYLKFYYYEREILGEKDRNFRESGR